MTEALAGQVGIFDQDIWSGKMLSGPRVPALPKGKTSVSSLKKLQGYPKKMPLFLDLRGGGGAIVEPLWETDGVLLGEYMMPSFGEFRKEEEGLLCWQTSMETPLREYYLILNCGEKPREPNQTKLSEIIEENPDQRFTLSAKACQGILNRARKRQKTLPKELEEALTAQATQPTSSEELIPKE